MRELPPNMTDYEGTHASFRLEVPEVYNYATDVVDGWAAKEPERVALVAVGPTGGAARRFTFGDISRSSNRAANFLAAQGVRKGDRVFLMLPRVPEWYDVALGCIKLVALPMPGTTLLTGRDIAYRIDRAGATVAVTDLDGVAKVDEAADRCPTLTTKVCVDPAGGDGQAPAGWQAWGAGVAAASERPPGAEPTRASDPLLLYFTSGTVAQPSVGLLPSPRTTHIGVV